MTYDVVVVETEAIGLQRAKSENQADKARGEHVCTGTAAGRRGGELLSWSFLFHTHAAYILSVCLIRP